MAEKEGVLLEKIRLVKAVFCTLLAPFFLSASASPQGFINLDFEQATVPPIDPSSQYAFLSWRQSAPGWSHSEGGDTDSLYYLSAHLGLTQAYLLVDSLSPAGGPGPLEGKYSLAFWNGTYYGDGSGGYVNAFIAQTGLIPSDTRSVRVLALGLFRVYVNGNEIPMAHLEGFQFGGDISAYAGSVAELKILNAARPIPSEFHAFLFVDGIQFSPTAIPEPSFLVLLAFGAAALLWRRRKAPRA